MHEFFNIGNSGDNLISGGLGADTMEGGLGDDIYVVTELGDKIIDIGGNDTVRTSIDLNYLYSDIENIEIIGLDDTNVVGNSADNYIRGNSGSNVLDGSSGSDVLFGGLGSDVFVISTISENDVNSILDFKTGEDVIAIDVVGTGLIAPGDLGSSWLVSSGFTSDNLLISTQASNKDADDFLRYDPTTGRLFADKDADGIGDEFLIAELVGMSTDIEFLDILLTL